MLSAAYVAGWLERNCKVLIKYNDEEPLVASEVKEFVAEVSRGSLKVSPQCTYELVIFGLTLVKISKSQSLLSPLSSYNFVHNAVFVYDIGPPCDNLLRYLASVILKGLNNLEKDYQTN